MTFDYAQHLADRGKEADGVTAAVQVEAAVFELDALAPHVPEPIRRRIERVANDLFGIIDSVS